MRTKRFLLVTAALSTVACGKNPATPDQKDAEVLPLPANPKGSFYDGSAELPTPVPPPPAEDAGADGSVKNPPPPPVKDAGAGPIKPHPLPANPKGSFYDGGKKPPKLSE